MENKWINYSKNRLLIKITGKNINRFIRKVIDNKIDILHMNYINFKEIEILIYKKDYQKLKEIKTIYDIVILDTLGVSKIKKFIYKNQYFLFFLLIGIIIFYGLVNTIFEIEVIHSSSSIRNLINEELKKEGLKVYTFKKNYKKLQIIKENILNKYKDKIEWIEIEEVGTKYIVRVEERIITIEESQKKYQNITAKKAAILVKIDAKSGEIIKNVNEYVKKGEVVISGIIKLYDEIQEFVSAQGQIFGEVWYKVQVEYPLYYKEEKITNNKNKVLVIKFLGKNIELFNFNKYKFKNIEENILLQSNLIPLKLVYEKQTEKEIIEENLTIEEATNKAIKVATSKIESKLSDNEKIISTKKLKVEQNNSKIIVEVFFAVCEDITDIQEIVTQ
ncbi:MAG: sporulation protein YqfD [Bacilli bacterium]